MVALLDSNYGLHLQSFPLGTSLLLLLLLLRQKRPNTPTDSLGKIKTRQGCLKRWNCSGTSLRWLSYLTRHVEVSLHARCALKDQWAHLYIRSWGGDWVLLPQALVLGQPELVTQLICGLCWQMWSLTKCSHHRRFSFAASQKQGWSEWRNLKHMSRICSFFHSLVTGPVIREGEKKHPLLFFLSFFFKKTQISVPSKAFIT